MSSLRQNLGPQHMELPSACVCEGNACISEGVACICKGVYLQGGTPIRKGGPLYLRGEVLVSARGVLWDARICQNTVHVVARGCLYFRRWCLYPRRKYKRHPSQIQAPTLANTSD